MAAPERRSVRWQNAAGDGLEHLVLTRRADGATVAESVVVGPDFGLVYRIAFDGRWCPREVSVNVAGGARLTLSADGAGTWSGRDGRPIEALTGAIDIDIAATPFTNTPAIRRLDLGPGESAETSVVYVPAPDLVTRRLAQRYSCIDPGRYRYENLESGCSAELEVDADGLVVRYPDSFRRTA